MNKTLLALLGVVAVLLVAAGAAFWFLFALDRESEPAPLQPLVRERSDRVASPEDVAHPDRAPTDPAARAGGGAPATAREAVEVAEAGERFGAWERDRARFVDGRVLAPAGLDADPTLVVLSLTAEAGPEALYGAGGLATPAGRAAYAAREAGGAGILVAVEKVRPDGTFRAVFPPDVDVGWLAVEGRFLYSRQPTRVDLRAEAPEADVRAAAGSWITGLVHVPSGVDAASAYAGMEVVLGPDSSQFSFLDIDGGWLFARSATVGPSGHFELRAVDSSLPYELAITSERLATYTRDSLDLAEGRRLELEATLVRGASVAGVVVDPEGRPVAGARIAARRSGLWGMPGQLVASAESAADGTYVLGGVPAGRAVVVASSEGLLSSSPRPFDLDGGEQHADVRLALESGTTLAGVVRWADGEPAAGARVEVEFDPNAMMGMSFLNAARGANGSARADAQGRFRVPGLGNGPFLVTASAVRDPDADTPDRWATRLDGVQADSRDVELVLEPKPLLAGRVVDAEGAPVPAFDLLANAQGAVFWLPGRTVEHRIESEDGSFTLTDLDAGVWTVTAVAEGFARSQPLEVTLPRPEEAETVELVLPRAAAVAGTVLGPRGAPVAGAKVALVTDMTQSFAELGGHLELPAAYTDEAGAFELTGLTPGSLSIVASHPEHCASESRPLTVAASERVEGVVLDLREGATITGEVYQDGERAGGVQVMLQDMATFEPRIARTAADGTFRFERVRPGEWNVSAMLADVTPGVGEDGAPSAADFTDAFAMQSVSVKDGQEEHVVLGATPTNPVVVHGTVQHGGAPVRSSTALVTFYPEGASGFGGMRFASLDGEGRYEIELDEPGAYLVQFQANSEAGGRFQQQNVELTETIPEVERHRLDLDLPVGRISGRVEGPDGDPVSGVRVTLTTDGGVAYGTFLGGQYAEAMTGDGGRYELGYLRPGSYTVAAGGSLFGGAFGTHGEHGRELRSGIEVSEGEHRERVDFRLARAGELTGVVVDAAGNPVPRAAVFYRDAEGRLLERFSMNTTGPDGRFRCTGVAPGRYTVSARAAGLAGVAREPVTVPEGGKAEARVALAEGTRLLVSVLDRSGENARARVSVRDEAGHEVNGMFSWTEMTQGGTTYSTTEQQVGPLPPGSYEVTVTTDDGRTTTKPVTLTGQPERRLKLRLR